MHGVLHCSNSSKPLLRSLDGKLVAKEEINNRRLVEMFEGLVPENQEEASAEIKWKKGGAGR